MITTYCRECGAGPMDLPRSEVCDDCKVELLGEEPAMGEFVFEHDEGDEEFESGYVR